MRRFAAFFAITTVALSACSLLVDTKGLAGGSATEIPDAAITSADASSGGTDAAAEADATPDGGVSASPCAVTHTFCDDFDTGGDDLTKRWDELATGSGPLVFDSTRSTSAPRSLRMNVQSGNGHPQSKLERSLPFPENGSARVELDLYVGSAPDTYYELDPIGLQLDPPPPGYELNGIYFVLRVNQTLLQYFADKLGDGGDITTDTPLEPISRDAWHHFAFTVSLATHKATLVIDNRPVKTVDINAASSPTSIRVQVGAPYTQDPKLSWALNFDNVAVDIH